MAYVQAMYCPAVNNQFTGYNYGSMESDADSSFRVLKVKKAPSKGAVKRENFKQYHYNMRGYTVQSQSRANECQVCANSKYFIKIRNILRQNNKKYAFYLDTRLRAKAARTFGA